MDSARTDHLKRLPALRTHWSERALVFTAPAALAMGLGALGGPAAGAAAGLVGAGLGVGLSVVAQAAAQRRLAALDEARADALEEAREHSRTQLGEIVAEAARTGAEFERRAVFAEDARRAQNRLLADLAPEFYALLRSMGHHAEQLRALELEPEDEQAADALCDATGSLRRLLGAVLDLARARAGRLRLRERDFDLANALDRIGQSFGGVADTKGVEFRIALGRLSNHWRFGDERRLQQVLERVLSAALDTCERGAIELEVVEDAERPDRLVFTITDSAPIHDQASFERLLTESPGSLDNLFELDASLSFALARGLVEVLGGSIEASARAEGGHSIRIALPFAIGSDPAGPTEASSADGVGLRMVVAAPAGHDGDLVEAVASGLGWIVERATDGDAVEEALAAQDPLDVLVVGAGLDDGCGAALLSRWLERSPGAVGALLLDAGVALDPRDAAASGARLCLTGPLHPGRLRELFSDLALASTLAPRPSARVLLASPSDDTAAAETAALEADGSVVDRVGDLEGLVDAFQDAVYGLVLVDAALLPDAECEHRLTERLEELRGLSSGPFKIQVFEDGQEQEHAASREAVAASGSNSDSSRAAATPTQSSPMNPHAAVDKAVLESLRELGGDDEPGLVRELVELFVGDTPGRLEALHDAVRKGDFDEAGRVAHALKSSSGNLGASILAQICAAIEESCREGDVDSVPSLVERTLNEYERVRDELSSELD